MPIIEEIIKEYKNYEIDALSKKLVEQFLKADVKYAIGRNEYSEMLCNMYGLDYIVDDYTNDDTFHNAKIIKFNDIPQGVYIANCVLNARYTEVHERLEEQGAIPIDYLDVCNALPEKVEPPYWIKDTRKEVIEHPEKFQNVYDFLADEVSKKTFADVLLFRLTADRKYLEKYEIGLINQYFENFSLKNTEIFVDCGGFDGETTKQYIKNCPNYKKIYFFEPSIENLNVAKSNLKTYKNIEYINKGTSNENKILRFNTSLGSSSNFSENGEITIAVTPIDDYLNEQNALIKMDIEGSEMNALKGAANSIAKYLPNLAICIYHKASDFYKVFDFITEISNNGYEKPYIRHYSQGWNETVIFFTKK
ncbi:MAG: FkbM family methyltransferase [Candidatus Gastranaerophilales bacterium]|nr:FkbM family methyltransferase [Candidatus Gastranaerophilales bacterium]